MTAHDRKRKKRVD